MEATICFFDTECNGLDTDHGFVMELAWAVYDVRKMRCLSAESHLLKWNMQYEVEKEAQAVTGLTREFCEANGSPAGEVFTKFLLASSKCFAVAGHNVINFDKKIMKSNIMRALFSEPKQFLDQFTFDTYFDCPYPSTQKQMSLKYLALDHGYILNGAHEALNDVFASAFVFFKYKFAECLEIARTPLMTINGYTDFHDVEGREKFYKAKFRWNRDYKRWEKQLRAYHIPGTQLTLGDYNLYTAEGGAIRVLDDSPAKESPNEQEIPF